MKNSRELLTKSDADLALEIIHSCLFCRNELQFRQIVTNLGNLIPYDFALCGFGKIRRDSNESYNVINVSYPANWVETYVSQGLEAKDPIVYENFKSYNVQYWADTYKKYNNCESFVSTAEEFGLKEGYSYGLKTYNGDKTSLFSFAARSMERHPRTELILEYIIPHLHQAFEMISDSRRETHNECTTQLSAREKEILQWAREGKSTWEISVILSISKDTVKFHIKNVMQKLQVVSRTQAVAAALQNGLIGFE
ncbi:MAG TPA: LuxR C-terminal-related transcriptional regulator [Syntrophorhabdaceae bacterium]|nr:LuxR C-terminal-related transcriptional regulator [Syntrophorhabdaceae bacterium]